MTETQYVFNKKNEIRLYNAGYQLVNEFDFQYDTNFTCMDCTINGKKLLNLYGHAVNIKEVLKETSEPIDNFNFNTDLFIALIRVENSQLLVQPEKVTCQIEVKENTYGGFIYKLNYNVWLHAPSGGGRRTKGRKHLYIRRQSSLRVAHRKIKSKKTKKRALLR